MKEDRRANWGAVRRNMAVLVLAVAALAALLALGGFFAPPAMAADFLVTETSPGVYQLADDTVVYPVETRVQDGSGAGWSVSQITAGGYTYQDSGGAFYAPGGASDVSVTISGTGYWLPVESDAQRPVSVNFMGGTTLTYSFTSVSVVGNAFLLEITPPSLEAQYQPQISEHYLTEVRVPISAGIYGSDYYLSLDGILFQRVVELRMEHVPMDSISGEGLYNLRFTQVDGEYAYGYFLPGTTVTLRAEGDFRFGDYTDWQYLYSGVTLTTADSQTIAIDTETTITDDAGEEETQLVLNMDILPPITVNFAFTESGYASAVVNYEEVTSTTVRQGEDLAFSLQADPARYTVNDWRTAITGCMLQGQWDEESYPVNSFLISEYGDVTIGSGEFGNEETYTLTLTVDPAAFTRLVTVLDASGPGYTLTCMSGTMSGEPGYISLHLKVDAAYNQSQPVLTAPEGWVIQGNMEGGQMEDGSMEYYILMEYGDGTQPVPASPMDLTVTVSGIVANPGGGGGGGGGGGSSGEPEIRVENELNQEGASSDTMLWPNGTTEQNGVSTTTVTDEELEALIDLAQQHAEDIKELEGDGYKEGIIVIEDLEPTSNIHTYILELADSQFQRISQEEWDRFTVQTPAGSISLYGGSIQQVAGGDGEVTFTIARLEYEGRPGADITLEVNGQAVTEFTEVYGVRVFVPYQPVEDEDANALLMDYLPEDGPSERVTESFYDAVTGGVYAFTGHLSKFGVAYRPAVYTDVGADHWANPYVTFLAARGLLDQGAAFRPDDKATRGELLELLGEALSAANLPNRAVQVYSDVPATASVARAASWAYYNNLTGAIAGNGKLRPNEAVTREDMAALTGNVASGVGLRLRSKGLDTGYTDLSEVASYARTSVTRLRAAGILEMPDNYKFNPDATLNRGEMAQIVATLLSSL